MLLARGRWKVFHKLLIGADQKVGLENVPMKEGHNRAVGSIKANKKKNRKLYHLNEVASRI